MTHSILVLAVENVNPCHGEEQGKIGILKCLFADSVCPNKLDCNENEAIVLARPKKKPNYDAEQVLRDLIAAVSERTIHRLLMRSISL